MHRTIRYWRAGILGLLLAGGSLALPAQTQPQLQSGEVVTLPAFDVAGDVTHGYVASESLTGTRIASKIQDLPFAVNVVTADFMNDFGLYDLNSQLSFVSGFSPSEVPGQFQLRGFPAPISMVDGFRRIGLVDVVEIAREEVIKGTAASIYGAVPPGGAVNIITIQPSAQPTTAARISGGSDDFIRGTFYNSGPLPGNKHLFYSVSASYMSQKFAQDFASKHDTQVDGKLLYKPNDNTSLTLDFSHHELYAHPFVQTLAVTEKQTMPWAGNSVTESQYFGLATNLENYNYEGPESYYHQRVSSGTLTLDHRFSDVYSVKFGANAFINPYNDQLIGSGAYYPYGTGNVTVVNGIVQQPFTPEVKDQPQVDWQTQRGGGMQWDNLFAFDTGPVKNKLLVTGDYYELSQRYLTENAVAGGAEATDYYALFSPYNPAGAPYYTPQTTWSPAMGYGWNTTLYGSNPSLYSDVTTDQWLASGDYGLFGSEQASLFNDRLIFMAGGRWDYVRNQVKNYNIAGPGGLSYTVGSALPKPYQAFDYNTSAWTYQLGASFQVLPGFNVYANKSSGFNPQPQINTNTGLALPNNTSNGYEFGVKGSLLHNRFTFTADRFLINEYNLAQTETDPTTGVKDTVLAGQERSAGYEFDGQYEVSDGLYVQGNWGYTKARVLNANPLTFYDDLPIRRVPRNNVGAAVKYQFSSGPLRGLFFLGDFNYYSKSLVNLGSGKSLIPGPAGSASGSAGSIYYSAASNLTYTGADPKIAGEQKIGTVPFNNVPLPGNGQLPYPSLPAGAVINFPMGANGQPLPLANPAVPGIYTGLPEGVFVDDGRENIFNAPYAVFGFGTGYSWKNGHYTHTLQANITNLFNREYTWAGGVPGLPFGIRVMYSLGF